MKGDARGWNMTRNQLSDRAGRVERRPRLTAAGMSSAAQVGMYRVLCIHWPCSS
jgi:hypothetical protein